MTAALDPTLLGATTFVACQADPRFSYCLHVPSDYGPSETTKRELLVVVHDGLRDAGRWRDAYSEFSERTGAVVLAPLFPAGIVDPEAVSNFALLTSLGVRYDLVLLAMVDEVRRRYGLAGGRFCLSGFSGGGAFAHRFLYLHPQRLKAVSVGAPGMVTLFDESRDWWVGLRDAKTVFGHAVAAEDLRGVAIQAVVGDRDLRPDGIMVGPDDRSWGMPDANIAGASRRERLRAWVESLAAQGIGADLVIVEGVGHRGFGPVTAAMQRFLLPHCLCAGRSRGVHIG